MILGAVLAGGQSSRFGSDKAFQSFLERTSQSELDVKVDLEKNLLRDKLFAKMLSIWKHLIVVRKNLPAHSRRCLRN